ncbi:MAG: glycosyltransferase [Pseudomonadota bacterium]
MKNPGENANRKFDKKISVVITAHNEAEAIKDVIESLSEQKGVAIEDTEIILVDDRSIDGTSDVAKSLGVKNLQIIENSVSEKNLTSRQLALDTGFNASVGELTMVLDADAVPGDHWLLHNLECISDAKVDAVAGPVVFHSSENSWISDWQTADANYYFMISLLVNESGGAGGVFFGNFSFRSNLYEELGGFENIGFTLTEDLEFARTLNSRSRKICYSFNAPVTVSACTNLSELADRTLRVASSSPSLLTYVLTAVPASLLVLLLVAISMNSQTIWLLLACRYLLGVSFVAYATWKTAGSIYLRASLIYEPLVLLITPLVLIRAFSTRKIKWGGIAYDR